MRRAAAGLAALLAAAAMAQGETLSPGPDAASVTIYHYGYASTDDLLHADPQDLESEYGIAVVSEYREIDVPAGPAEIRFRGVASSMVPESAQIEGLPAGVVEQNFDYDLLSPGSLLAKSIGQTVHLIRTDPKTGKETDTPAIVRTGPDGAMLEIDGKLEALHCSALPERLVFDKTPDGLTDTPTLAVRTNAPLAGHYRVRLSYIATALNWSADYVAHVRPGGNTLDLSGWVTLANFGTTGFKQVPIYTVAGKLNTSGNDTLAAPHAATAAPLCWPMDVRWWHRPTPEDLKARQVNSIGEGDLEYSPATETVIVTGSRIPDPRALGDYKIYALPEPTDLPAHETKQVQFLDLRDVPFKRVYTYYASPEDDNGTDDQGEPARLVLRLTNKQESGLGKPLPAGLVAVTETGRGGAGDVYVAQSGIKDIPVGLDFEIPAAEMVRVAVKQRLVSEEHIGKGDDAHVHRSFAIEIANDRDDAIDFELTMPTGSYEAQILSESRPHEGSGSGAVWRLHLLPGTREEMQVTVDTRY
jgi:hypothetical protein